MFVIKSAFHCIIFSVVLYIVTGHHHHHNHQPRYHNIERGSIISTKELRRISEELFDKHPDGILQLLNINYQRQRDMKDAKDEAPEPLFMLPRDFFQTMPTVQLMHRLYDNYDVNSLHAEDVTPEENAEEDDFIDGILKTDVLIHSMDFLANKGFFLKDLDEYKRILKKIWFQPYARSNHTNNLGSSGFEHVFLVEKKRGNHISGLHNWIFFATEEYENKADYLGYIHMKQLANKIAILQFYLSFMGKTKLTSMFIGTSPEFEIALYTLCFFARPNKSCKVLLGNEKLTIQTLVQHSNNEELIGSSFPKIYN